jgi:hypothetical protein
MWLVPLLVLAWITKINSNKWQMRPCSLHTRSPSLLPSTQPRAETNRVAARAAGDGGPRAVRCGLRHLHDREVDAAVIEHPLVTSLRTLRSIAFSTLSRCSSPSMSLWRRRHRRRCHHHLTCTVPADPRYDNPTRENIILSPKPIHFGQ